PPAATAPTPLTPDRGARRPRSDPNARARRWPRCVATGHVSVPPVCRVARPLRSSWGVWHAENFLVSPVHQSFTVALNRCRLRLGFSRTPHEQGGGVRRTVSIVVAAVLAIVVIVTIVIAAGGGSSKKKLTTVRGAIGSEKQPFFDDPLVKKAFAS